MEPIDTVSYPSTNKPSEEVRNRIVDVLLVGLLFATAIAVPRTTSAQTGTFGSIEGTVRDASDAVLPGVTLTLTSPVLQVPQLIAVSDGEGRYRFPELRLGAYRIQSELVGFQTFVRENLELDAGFVARVDIVMKVGSLSETVTVTSASPVVDLTTTRGGQAIRTQLITKSIPMFGHVVDVVRVTPGLEGGVGSRAASPTGMGLGFNLTVSAYGQSGNTSMIEDFQVFGVVQHAMLGATEQMDVKTFGNTAEVQNPGVALNYVFGSGGNEFRGKLSSSFQNDSLASTNLDSALRTQGFTAPEVARNYYDVGGHLGGRLVRDKVWFFGAGRKRGSERTVGGFVLNPGPDGKYLTGDEPAATPDSEQHGQVLKLSYQMTPKYQLVGFFYHDYTKSEGATTGFLGGGNPRTVPWEASSVYSIEQYFWNGQYRGAPKNNLTFDFKAGLTNYWTKYNFPPGVELRPPTRDRDTGLYTGVSISDGTGVNAAQRRGNPYYYQAVGSMTYVPAASFFRSDHQLKMGFRSRIATIAAYAANHPVGNYMLVFDTVSGVPHRPVEIVTVSLPVVNKNRDNVNSLYMTDQWRVNQRLALNLGLRVESEQAFVPPQTQESSTFAQAASYPRIEVAAWKTWAPRAAMAWDVSGRGTTVLKTTYGWFNAETTGTGTSSIAEDYNPVTPTQTTYHWHDLNGNNDYDFGEVDLRLNGPDFINISSPANLRPIGPDVKMPHSHEFAVSIERELIPGMGGRFLYLYKRQANDFVTLNVGRPYSAFNIPLRRRDPGPDGAVNTADDGPMVTIYDYDPAYVGSQFVIQERVNRPSDRSDIAYTLEGAINKRLSNRWSLTTSYGATKQHRWLTAIPLSPNDDYYPLDETWSHSFRVNGSYLLPFDVLLGGSLNVLNGIRGQRTYVFRAADPLGGPSLRQQTTVNLRLEPFGASSGPVRSYLDLRLGKTLRLGQRELDLDLDILNALNTNAAEVITRVTGPTYGQITQIPTPRALRLGAQYSF